MAVILFIFLNSQIVNIELAGDFLKTKLRSRDSYTIRMSYFNRTALNVTDSGKKDKFVVTFLDGLDTVAGEKLFALCGSIVEVCGTSGTGKTTIWWVCCSLDLNNNNP